MAVVAKVSHQGRENDRSCAPDDHPCHAGVCDECPTGQGGVLTGMPANAVSMGSHPLRILLPHGPVRDCALTGAGIVDGAKNSIAPINAVLTILRSFICRPPA